MEHIYLPENVGWATEPIPINSYFSECKSVIEEIFAENADESKNKLKLKSKSHEIQYLEGKKKCLKSPNAVNLYSMFPKLEFPTKDVTNLQMSFMTNRRYEFQSECIKSVFRKSDQARKSEYTSLKTKLKSFLKYDDYMYGKRFKPAIPQTTTPYSEVVLEIHLFNPLSNQECWSPKACNCTHLVKVLGSQPLTVLAEKIRCINNFTDMAGDVSDNPDTPVTLTLKEMFPSSMFYFGNNFYIDGDKDYSAVVKEWGKRKDLTFGETYQMKDTCFKDLSIRLNYPYVYQHLGDCEHTVVFSEVRFLDATDPEIESFPRVRYLEDPMVHKCFICGHFYARWMVKNSDRLVFGLNALCEICFKKYHYVKGKKVGQFEAFRILLDKAE